MIHDEECRSRYSEVILGEECRSRYSEVILGEECRSRCAAAVSDASRGSGIPLEVDLDGLRSASHLLT
jgi:hypothetical protein